MLCRIPAPKTVPDVGISKNWQLVAACLPDVPLIALAPKPLNPKPVVCVSSFVIEIIVGRGMLASGLQFLQCSETSSDFAGEALGTCPSMETNRSASNTWRCMSEPHL